MVRPLLMSTTALLIRSVSSLQGIPMPLCLGSKSTSRTALLKETGIPFEPLLYPIDEKAIGNRDEDDPSALVTKIAVAKADAIVSAVRRGDLKLPAPLALDDGIGACILTADQVVVCDGVVREKPRDLDEAISFVRNYGTKPPETVGSVVLTHMPTGAQAIRTFIGRVVFEDRIGAEAESLVRAIEADKDENGGISCLDCAGGLMVENERVQAYVERVEGGEDAVMGLRKEAVLEVMKELSEALS